MLTVQSSGRLYSRLPPPLPSPPGVRRFQGHGRRPWRKSPPALVFPISAASDDPKSPIPARRLSKLSSSSSSSSPPRRPPNDVAPWEEEMGEVEICKGCGQEFKKKHLSELSSWGIGGPCRYFIEASSRSQLVSAIRFCRSQSMPFLVIGKGSNCLFDDRGFDGCVILNRLDFLEKTGSGKYRVGSGYPFNRLGIRCSREGYTGLEFGGGVPGTVGGAVFMNAGADGQETADCTEGVEIMKTGGEVLELRRIDLTFGYRSSFFQEMEDLAAILAVTFRLTPCESALERQRESLERYSARDRRKRSQPVGAKSAGSVFRNPRGSEMSAGQLIEKAGMKGFRVGGAKVSEVHANFFVNFKGSSSRDMRGLIGIVKERVHRKFEVELHEEVRYVPYDVTC